MRDLWRWAAWSCVFPFTSQAVSLRYLDPTISIPGVYVNEEPTSTAVVPASMGGTVFFGTVYEGVVPPAWSDKWPLIGPLDASAVSLLTNSTSAIVCSAVSSFFQFSTASGGPLYLSACQDSSAESLVACISSFTPPPGVELFVVPALASLNSGDYLQVALALGNLASSADGLAILDPPSSIVSVWQSAGIGLGIENLGLLVNISNALSDASSAPQCMVLYSSPLISPQASSSCSTAVSSASLMAGVISGLTFPWESPAGAGHAIPPFLPAVTLSTGEIGYLNPSGINSFLAPPNSYTMPWGARTLAAGSSAVSVDRYISTVRTVSYIRRSIQAYLDSFATESNVLQTRDQLQLGVWSFLNDIFQASGLYGTSPDQAFTVSVALGSTVSQISQAPILVSVQLALIYPAEFTTLTFQKKCL